MSESSFISPGRLVNQLTRLSEMCIQLQRHGDVFLYTRLYDLIKLIESKIPLIFLEDKRTKVSFRKVQNDIRQNLNTIIDSILQTAECVVDTTSGDFGFNGPASTFTVYSSHDLETEQRITSDYNNVCRDIVLVNISLTSLER